ncbi:hypothetical protein RJ641_020548 [Dillenia turbinata]|uniref:Uncharacterized protein n=1 Tax=Dillenia turbinata TaxID=194707 RepID=A0AAN8UQ65_9MAGN
MATGNWNALDKPTDRPRQSCNGYANTPLSPTQPLSTCKLLQEFNHYHLKNNRDCYDPKKESVLVYPRKNVLFLQPSSIKLIEHLAQHKGVEDECFLHLLTHTKDGLTFELQGQQNNHPTGGFAMRSFVGCSVAKAKAPKVSIMRFTQRSCTAVSGTLPEETAAAKLIARAATFTFLNVTPSITASFSKFSSVLRIPHSRAIAFAVNGLSPVTILMFTPAFLQDSTAALRPGRHGSFKPRNPNKLLINLSIYFCTPFVAQGNASQTFCCHALNYCLKLPSVVIIHGSDSPISLVQTPCSRSSRTFDAISVEALTSNASFPSQNSVTLISFKVRVPVLSVQIVVADPIVSQAESLRTIALSAIILFIE